MVRRLIVIALLLSGCGSPGAVTFTIHAPSADLLNPMLDPRVTEFLLKAADGALVGAVSPRDGMDSLPLGPLSQRTAPVDMTMSVLGGTDLLGMARIRDVQVEPGIQNSYVAEVRKPFVFVGSTLPDEPHASPPNHLHTSEVLDPSTSTDLAPGLSMGAQAVKLPAGVSAATATSDGRFLLAGHGGATQGLSIVDTGSALTVGEAPLSFQPWRVVAAARDTAVAVLDATGPDGAVLLFTDVAGLTSSAGAQTPIKIVLRAETPRNAAFSPDGQTLYVLSGDGTNLDPCGAATRPTANVIRAFGLDGQAQAAWDLPSFGGDLAVDPASGTVVVSMPVGNQVGTIAAGTAAGPVSPQKLLDNVTCPSALHVTNGQVYVASAEEDPVNAPDTYQIVRVPMAGGTSTALFFPQPLYQHEINDSQPNDGKIGFTLRLKPKFFYAYEMAISPDASRVVLDTRTHYSELNENFSLLADLNLNCTTTVEVVEYGRYVLDTRNGTANYELRSQIVTEAAQEKTCTTCENVLVTIGFGCPTTVGDRPAGLAGVFATP